MDANAMKYVAIGLSSISFFGAALGVSIVFKAALEGIARNPSAESGISKYIFVGAGLVEAMGLFALVISLILIFM